MAKCSTCGQAILWALTEGGKKVPLNHPPERRFVEMDRHLPADEMRVRITTTWLSHFATCPQADKHRKEKPLPGSTEDYLTEEDDRG